jgi:Cu+-exporting ATPase
MQLCQGGAQILGTIGHRNGHGSALAFLPFAAHLRAMVEVSRVELRIDGMHCAACVRRVEHALQAVPGVSGVSVNLATERASLAAARPFRLRDAVAALQSAGFRVAAARDPAAERASFARERTMALAALIMAAPLLIPALPRPVQFTLAALIQIVFGARFYRGAWSALRAGGGDMDTLVALGTTAAFVLSVWQWALGGSHVYFEASAVVIALVRLGKWMERRARSRAGDALRALATLQPEMARVRRDGVDHDVPASTLAVGDVMVVRPGSRIPADGLVREGQGSADESLLTGESLPVAKEPGSTVIGGAVNGDTLLLVEVTAIGAESRLSRMVRLVEAAQADKPKVQRLVDRVSAVFVPVVVVLALATFFFWWAHGAPLSVACIDAVSVLVIACPCALGLATPVALLVGTGAAARRGIVISDASVVERARAIRTVVFDKTGTLTEGRPDLVAALPAPGTEKSLLLSLAASVQSGSEHVLARAVRASTASLEVPPASATQSLPGRGVRAEVAGQTVLLGSERLMREHAVDVTSVAPDAALLLAAGRTISYLAASGKLIGLLAFGDLPRPNAAAAVASLRAQGMHVVLLSGDRREAAVPLGRLVGIDDIRAEALPEDKANAIAALRREGGVAMVGDGVNDAASLAAADIGIAMGGGTDAASEAAGITLMRGDPLLVPQALAIARETGNRIRQGLFWAFIYNLVGLPLAAAGQLSPVIAGAAMALSSLSVVVGVAGRPIRIDPAAQARR